MIGETTLYKNILFLSQNKKVHQLSIEHDIIDIRKGNTLKDTAFKTG